MHWFFASRLIAVGVLVRSGWVAAAALVDEVWISARVQEAQLSTLRSETFPSRSLLHCLSLGTAFDWSFVACYSQQKCTLWEMDAFGFGEVEKDGTLGPTKCKTLKRKFGCVNSNKTVTPLHEKVGDAYCPNNVQFQCTLDDFVEIKIAPPMSVCSDPFTEVDGVGCLHISTIPKNFCQARHFCRQKGADLIRFETQEKYDRLKDYLSNSNNINFFYVGAMQPNPGHLPFRWTNTDLDVQQNFWYPGEPNGYTFERCVVLAYHEDRRGLWDIPCSNSHYFICEAKIQN